MFVPGSGSRPVGGTFVCTVLAILLEGTVASTEDDTIKVIVELPVVELDIWVGFGPIIVFADRLEVVDSISVLSSSSTSEGVLDSPSDEVVGVGVPDPTPVGM